MRSSRPVGLGRSRAAIRRRRAAARRAVMGTVGALIAAVLTIGGLAVPAYAAGSIDIVKKLDAIQQEANTTDVFKVNGIVRYRLKISCSSLTEDCGVGTVRDVLDPNLEFVEVIKPTGTMPNGRGYPPMASSYDAASREVKVTIGDGANPFQGGDSAEFVVVARVKGQPADPDGDGYGVIPNTATAQSLGGPVVPSSRVDIRIPAATPDWKLSKASDPGAIAPGESVRYPVSIDAAILGNLDAGSITLVDTYPAGAVVVDPVGGVVDTANHTITWTFTDVKLSNMDTSTGRARWEPVRPVLTFPAGAFTAGQTVTNNVRAAVTYTNGAKETLNASATTAFVAPVTGLAFRKEGPTQVTVGQAATWYLTSENKGTVALPVTVEETIPAGLTDVKISDMGNYTVEALIGGAWTSITGTVPNTATKLRMTRTVAANTSMVIYLTGTVTATAANPIVNCASATAPGVEGAKDACSTTPIVASYAQFRTSKQHIFADSAATSTKPGEEFTFGVSYIPVDGVLPPQVNIADVLPAQFEYVATTCIVNVADAGWTGGTADSLRAAIASSACTSGASGATPDITPATGPADGTTIVWKNVARPATVGMGTVTWVVFTVRVKPGVAVGSYTNTAYVDADGVDTRCRNADPVREPGDLDGDGAANEAVCAAVDSIIVDEASVIDLTKWDKGALPNIREATGEPDAACPDWDGYTRFPCVAVTPTNGDFSYRFKLQNIGNIDATRHVMYDILPYVGDTGVGQLLGAQPRATEWTPVLTGPIVIESQPRAANATVEYNLTTNPCRPEVAQGDTDRTWQDSCDGTWYTAAQITDWSAVKSFRVTSFGSGAAWKPLEEIVLRADMHAPKTATPSKKDPLDLSVAWNSTAHRGFRLNADGTTERLLAAEPRKVGVIVPFDGVSVGDRVWYDTDKDGVQDAGEAPAPDVTVTLRDATGAVVGTTTTNADGYYYFQFLTANSNYTVTFTAPSGYRFTKQNAGGDASNSATTDLTDSDVDPATGVIAFKTPADGENRAEPDKADNPGLDAGLIPTRTPVSIGDFTWYDTNKNGLQDSGEPAAPGVTVTLRKGGVVVGTTTTGADGYYAFGDLDPSTEYTVTLTPPANHAFTAQNAGGDTSNSPASDLTDSDADPATGAVTFTTPADGQNRTAPRTADNAGIDAGFVPLVSVGDYVWLDVNRDGLQGDPSVEKPIAGVTVTLKDASGAVLATTDTDADGYYFFKDLSSATRYSVTFGAPAGHVFTTQNAGGATSNSPTTDLTDSDADPTTGSVSFTTPASGSNRTGHGQADNPGLDAGFVGLINLSLTKALVPSGPYYAGSTVTFRLTPHNDGPVLALAGWSISDLLPAGLTLVSMTGDGYDCATASATCIAKAALGAGADGPVVTVTATVDTGVVSAVKNVAYIAPAAGDRPETNPLVVPTTGTDTAATPTDNDAQAIVPVASLVSVGDHVWWDANRDGQQTRGEQPVPGVRVALFAGTSTAALATTTTDADGYYWFTGLTPGAAYRVEFTKPAGAAFTTRDVGDDKSDSDADPDGVVRFTAPASGSDAAGANVTDDPTLDAGLVRYNLSLRKTLDTAGKVYAGSTVQFTLTPHNDGPVAALAGWSVTDLLPEGLTLVSLEGAGYVCDTDKATCVAAAPLGAAADGAPITVTATVGADVIGSARNIAYIAPARGDIAETNPLVVPTRTTDTVASPTDNDAEAPVRVDSLVSIGDHTWWDIDRDGIQSEGDRPAAGVKVNLYAADGTTLLASTTADEKGFYSFTSLTPGREYVVEFVAPDEAAFTTQNARNDDAKDSDADVASGRVRVIAPATGENSATTPDDPTIDAGFVRLNLTLVKELTSDGPFYAGSTATFTLTPHNDGEADALAGWSVVDALPAELELVSMSGDGYRCEGARCVSDTPLAAGADGAKISVVVKVGPGVKGSVHNVAYVAPARGDVAETNPLVIPTASTDTRTTPTDNDGEADLPVLPLVSVGDRVWMDVDRDGLQSDGEPPVTGVTVRLYAADGTTLVAQTTTDQNGFYSFVDLHASTSYVIEFVRPGGYSFTTQGGEDGSRNSDAEVRTGRVSFTSPAAGENSAVTPDDPTIDAGLVTYDLLVDKSLVGAATVKPGSTVTFTITPRNAGPADVRAGWTVVDQLPAGLTLVSIGGSGYTCAESSATCVAVAPLAAGASGPVITVVATVGTGVRGALANVSVVSASPDDAPEPNTTNNRDDATVNVMASPLAVTGGSLPWTLGVAGGAFLLLGLALILRRRRHRESS